MSYKAHLFICTADKKGKACCGAKNSESLRKELKTWAKEKWGKDVRINASGCLDRCSEGIAAVLYPEGQWFTELKEQDTDILKDAVRKSVQRSRPLVK